MAGNILWQSGAVISFSPQASGQGMLLNNGARVLASGDIYNTGVSGGPCLFGNFTLTCSASGFAAVVQNNQSINLYLLGLYGSDPTTGSTSGLPATLLRGSFVTPVSGNVGRLTMMVEGVPLMPIRYQTWLENNVGQNLTSGWSLFFEGFNQAYT